MQFTPKMGHFYFSICSNLSSRLGRSILPASHPGCISQIFQLIGASMLNKPCSACTIMFCFSGSLSSHRSCLPSLPYFPITFPISVSLPSHLGRSIMPASYLCHIFSTIYHNVLFSGSLSSHVGWSILPASLICDLL